MGIWATQGATDPTTWGGGLDANGQDTTGSDLARWKALQAHKFGATVPGWVQTNADVSAQQQQADQAQTAAALAMAQGQAAGGVTPQQQQLAAGLRAQQAGMSAMAAGAGGGARGAAAAGGQLAAQMPGQTIAGQGQTTMQQSADTLQGQQMASSLANQMQGINVQALGQTQNQAAAMAQYQQQMQGLQDKNALFYEGLPIQQEGVMTGVSLSGEKFGYDEMMAQSAMNRQMIGSAGQAAGAGAQLVGQAFQ